MLAMSSELEFMDAIKPDRVIDFALQRRLIPINKQCKCGSQMKKEYSNRYKCHFAFRCPVCTNRVSILTGTFFELSKLSISQILALTMHFIKDTDVTTAACSSNVSRNSSVHWYKICRNVCSSILLSQQQRFGGQGKIVEVDETLMIRRKYNVGRLPRQVWVFGMYDVENKKGMAVRIERRDAVTLLSMPY